MGDIEYKWVALTITGLALTSVSLLLDGFSPVIQYSFLALAVILGILAVRNASRNTPTP